MKTFINRKAKLKLIDLRNALHDEMIQYSIVEGRLEPDITSIKGVERPPMVEIPEYRQKFNIPS